MSSYIETTYKMHVSIFLIYIVIVVQIVFFNIRPCTSRHLEQTEEETVTGIVYLCIIILSWTMGSSVH